MRMYLGAALLSAALVIPMSGCGQTLPGSQPDPLQAAQCGGAYDAAATFDQQATGQMTTTPKKHPSGPSSTTKKRKGKVGQSTMTSEAVKGKQPQKATQNRQPQTGKMKTTDPKRNQPQQGHQSQKGTKR